MAIPTACCDSHDVVKFIVNIDENNGSKRYDNIYCQGVTLSNVQKVLAVTRYLLKSY